MAAIGELVRSTSGQWMARPPLRCPRGHTLRAGRVLGGSVACSGGRHLTWRCEWGALTYGPALAEGCSLLAARLDAQLGENLAQVVFDCARADEQPGADFRVGQAFPGHPRDLGLLRGELLIGRLQRANALLIAQQAH